MTSPALPAVADVADTADLADLPCAWTAHWQRWLAAADPAVLPLTIDELAACPAPAPGMASPSLRLGRHAERLLEFGLGHMENVSLLAVNLPVRRANGHGVQTMGELDFVWRDRVANQIVHWEMAAKFYLLAAPAEAAEAAGMDAVGWLRCFVGPNLVDRLGDKLAHIVRRQLPLAHTPEARSLLGASVDRSEAYLLGWLFYRDGIVPAGLDAIGLAPGHLRGWWTTLAGLAARQIPHAPGRRWCRLPRSQWLAPALVDESDSEDFDTLLADLAERFGDTAPEHGWRRETPVMVCELEPAGCTAQGVDGGRPLWRERSRGFVVPEGWAARAAARSQA